MGLAPAPRFAETLAYDDMRVSFFGHCPWQEPRRDLRIHPCTVLCQNCHYRTVEFPGEINFVTPLLSSLRPVICAALILNQRLERIPFPRMVSREMGERSS